MCVKYLLAFGIIKIVAVNISRKNWKATCKKGVITGPHQCEGQLIPDIREAYRHHHLDKVIMMIIPCSERGGQASFCSHPISRLVIKAWKEAFWKMKMINARKMITMMIGMIVKIFINSIAMNIIIGIKTIPCVAMFDPPTDGNDDDDKIWPKQFWQHARDKTYPLRAAAKTPLQLSSLGTGWGRMVGWDWFEY